MLPPTNASLFHCEWRVLLSPQCPYVSSLQQASEAGFFFLWIATALLLVQFLVRRFWWGFRVFRRGHYHKFNPIELIFLSSLNHVLWRAVQLTMLLYWKDSSIAPIVLTFFLSLSYFSGGACIIYYWLSLISAIPAEAIVGGGAFIRRLVEISKKGANLLFGCVSLTLILEPCSSAFIFSHQEVYDALLTVVYCLWVVVMLSMAIGVSWSGGRVKKMIINSISSQENHDLKRVLLSMKIGVFLITNLCSSMFLITLMMASTRYYVWSVPWFSITVYVIHALSPAVSCTTLCTILFCRDLFSKDQKGTRTGASSGRVSQKESFQESNAIKL